MEILYLLVPIALIVLFIAVKFLFWAISSGQYDDLNTEGQRILFDEDKVERKTRTTTSNQQNPAQHQEAENKNSD